jgi:hypothetical protein
LKKKIKIKIKIHYFKVLLDPDDPKDLGLRFGRVSKKIRGELI